MNTSRYFSMTALTAAIALGLTACGGGSSTTSSLDGSTASVTGVITGFGSIFVNGVEYETNGANITIDGQPGTEDDLRVGMVVTLEGSASGNSGTAVSISFSDEMEGLVDANNVDPNTGTGTMTVMGQTVEVTVDTVFDSKVTGIGSVGQVAAGHIVEVSGYSDGNGNVIATRIELKAQDLNSYLSQHASGIEMKGVISNLDTNAMTFDIGTQTVSYSGATLDDDLSGSLQDGLYVEVKSQQGKDGNGVLIASKVELENGGRMGHDGKAGEEYEMMGALVADPDSDGFQIDGQTILIGNSTKFEGITMDQLAKGDMVKVEGYIDADGNLVATEVKMERDSDSGSCNQEYKGTLVSVTLDSGAVNAGTIVMPGDVSIRIENDTMMKDDRDEGMMPDMKFNMSKLNAGDYVEVHACRSGDTLVATKLERDDAEDGDS